MFVILTEITLVLSICELYKKLWMEGYVCRICGISRQKLTVYFISEVAILFILGSGIALGLQASLHVPLSALDVGSLPAVENAAAGSLILFGISILLSSPMLIRVLRLQRSEGE